MRISIGGKFKLNEGAAAVDPHLTETGKAMPKIGALAANVKLSRIL